MLDLSPSLQDPLESFGYNDDDNSGREHTLKGNVQRQFLKQLSWQMRREKISEIFLADQNSMAPLIFSEDTIRIKRQEQGKLGGRGLTNRPFSIPSSKNFLVKEDAKCKSILSFKYEFHLRENLKKIYISLALHLVSLALKQRLQGSRNGPTDVCHYGVACITGAL